MNSIEVASEKIKQTGIIAILRGDFSVDDMIRVGEALIAGTVRIMEVTLNSPSAITALPELRKHFGEEMLIGAGTVRNEFQARAARDMGAQFLVSPNFNSETVTFARTNGMLHLPGVFTATEAQTAFAAGCRILKLFPMEGLISGPAYLKAIRAPLHDIEFVPTGGVSVENIEAYARAGAVAVGLGSKLVLNRDQSSIDLTSRARALRQAWEQSKHA
ncbi:MAG TPA: bifunctional 4-hydroxy-2-oxoglutarate aldolase/2-dehydro-3-deoxy-phosphogluconate aldolase [Anaerolineales bacterium]|nr:bifunctional 4-hydroxy-2-oxoglutarate aldolase/2-dehydro-3-deoxy-phosphogluconate aldolase [Anaerolineales bacterium]